MITTIQISHTEASIIRCVARQDMPAYGLKEGQVFYCAKSTSLGNNMYHILTWDYANTRWNCPCKCGEGYSHRVPCCHTNAASLDCKKQHTLQSYKPASKAEKFAALVQKYDVRYQTPAVEEVLAEAEQVAREAQKQLLELCQNPPKTEKLSAEEANAFFMEQAKQYYVSPEARRAGAFSILR